MSQANGQKTNWIVETHSNVPALALLASMACRSCSSSSSSLDGRVQEGAGLDERDGATGLLVELEDARNPVAAVGGVDRGVALGLGSPTLLDAAVVVAVAGKSLSMSLTSG